jgi:hypothetical protein
MNTKAEQLHLAVQLIALGNRVSRGLGSPEQLARLALIAAAPQLLEALRALMGDPSIEKCTMTNLEFCRAAIKAAEEE